MLETGSHGRQGEGSHIALALAIGISIAIHALILAAMSGLRERTGESQPDSLPLVARLTEPRIASSQPESSAELRRPDPDKPRPPERSVLSQGPSFQRSTALVQPRSEPTPAPAALLAAAPSVVPVPALASAEHILPVAARSGALQAARPGPAEAPAQAVASAAEADAIDPASVGKYRTALIAAAKRFRNYPRVALENNWEGRAEVRLAINANGSIASIGIGKRSGYEVLDQQALEMIRKAKPMATLPPALRGKGFILDVPVLFSLKEETG